MRTRLNELKGKLAEAGRRVLILEAGPARHQGHMISSTLHARRGLPDSGQNIHAVHLHHYTGPGLATALAACALTVTHLEDRDVVFHEIHRALEKRDHFQVVYRIRTADDRIKWVWDHGSGVFSAEGGLQFLEGFAFDITDHMRIQEELRMTEERFAKIFQASPDWVSITTLEDGAYIDVNDGYLKASGYTRDEVMGHTSLEIDIWERASDRRRLVRKIRDQGLVRNEEVRFRTKTGNLRSVLWSAVPITLGDRECILGWGRDITEYKYLCLLYTSPSPRDRTRSRMPSSA